MGLSHLLLKVSPKNGVQIGRRFIAIQIAAQATVVMTDESQSISKNLIAMSAPSLSWMYERFLSNL